MKLEFFVAGLPKGAGSKHGFAVRRKNASGQYEYTGKVAMIDTSGAAGKDWRGAIHYSAFEAMREQNVTPFKDEPLILRVEFIMPRPKSHFRTGKNAHILRDDAPSVHFSMPDATKLVRQLEDSLTKVAWDDDSRVCEIHAYKKYGDQPGAKVVISSYADEAVLRDTMAAKDFELK